MATRSMSPAALLHYQRGWRRAGLPPPPIVRFPLQLLVFVLLMALWQLGSELKILNPLLFSSPTKIAAQLYDMLSGQEFYGRTIYDNLWITFKEIGIGYLIGVAAGSILGFMVGRSRYLSRVLEPFVQAFFGIPKIAIAPFFVVILGIGLSTKVAIVAIEVFFIMFYNTLKGVLSIPRAYIEIAELTGCSPAAVIRRVLLPGSLPAMVDGLSMAVPFAVVGAIVGEFISSSSGIGWLVLYMGSSFDAAGTFAAIVVLMVLTLVLTGIVARLEPVLLPWTAAHAQTTGRPHDVQAQ